MKMQIARIAAQLVRQRSEEFLHDLSIPLTVRGMMNVHMTKPWIVDYWTVAIRAPKPGSEAYLDFPIGYAEDGTSWFFPSRQWWIAHAQTSHPPSGMGCDAEIHTKFLSAEGSVHEFDYASVFLDGRINIFGRVDFVDECVWWTRAFGASPPEAAP